MTTTPFSVIQGGIREEGRWSAELRHPASLREAEIAAWRALLPRALSPGFAGDPDFVLTLAQHLAEGRRLALLLVWQHGDGMPVLRGVLPLQLPAGLRPGRTAQLWVLPLAEGAAPVVDARETAAILRAALDHLAGAGSRVGTLRLPGLLPAGRLIAALREVAAASGRPLTVASRPAPGPAAEPLPTLPRGRTSLERVRAPRQLRDAVEHFLVLEGARPGPNLLHDADAATALRVVTRRFAQRRACGVDLVRRDGAVVAAAIRLGPAGQDRIWREAGCALAPARERPGVMLLDAAVSVAPARRAADGERRSA
ncbi:hypothetical protein M446_0230 [Methylobacterium sp. 4-46]|uniref:hypothetical protein n=1 Tax=unclassified Methylobacterium TaxID=2615210 RepID=UPI000152CDFE|nr:MULTISPECIES: hypothetical protein [Methylobacterium]ACA14802.1 hypothetical protein M446_0230 [Methylobacterium sp. 4-46]WFT80548.1 hypothetical protein QA634_01165 [Methylobacterium nodulans]